MRIKQITRKSDLSAKRSTSKHHCFIRYALTPNFLIGLNLCYVSKYLKYTSQQNLDTARLRSDTPSVFVTVIVNDE